MSKDVESKFVKEFSEFQVIVHHNAVKKGFWPSPEHDGLHIASIHAEISEALEAIRNGYPESTKITGYGNLTEELADAVLRIMSFCGEKGLPLAEAIEAKHKYNTGRPELHGKLF